MHYFRASEKLPRDPLLNRKIAATEYQRGNLPLAIQYYQKALAVSRDDQANDQMLAELGQAYSDLGDEKKAQECLAAAHRPHPSPPPPAIDWRGAWWRDIARWVRHRFSN